MTNIANRHPYKSTEIVPQVLVVDDDRDNLLFIGYALNLLGIKHLASQSSKVALDLAMDKLPDLILLDMVMPERDGINIARTLRKNPLTNHIPIIAVTGLTLVEHRTAIAAAGCDDYISKPLLIDELEAKVVKHLNRDLVEA